MATELDALEAERAKTQAALDGTNARLQALDSTNTARYLAQTSLLIAERQITERLLASQDLKLDGLRLAATQAATAARDADRARLTFECDKGERGLAAMVAELQTALDALAELTTKQHAAGGSWQAALRRPGLALAVTEALTYWRTVRPDALGLPAKPTAKERDRRELEQKIKDTEAGIKREEDRRPEPLEDYGMHDANLARAHEALQADRARLATYG